MFQITKSKLRSIKVVGDFDRHTTYGRHNSNGRHNRAGGMLVFIVFCLILLFVAAAISVDVAYMHVTRAELRTATDAAARAGVEALGRTQSREQALAAAKRFSTLNTVAGSPLRLNDDDVVFGSNRKQGGKIQFIPNGSPTNSMQVIGKRTSNGLNGGIPLFFGPIFGHREFEPTQLAVAARADLDVALVLDVSGSMGWDNRFNGLVNAVKIFIRELESTPQDELCSMSVYSTRGLKVTSMTSDLNQVNTDLERFRPGGLTAIGLGMRAGLTSFRDPSARPLALRAMIVMTDGYHNRDINPLQVVPEAVRENVTVHTITFSRGANQNLMRQVANAGNGIHLHANSNKQLEDAFRQIARQLSVILIQ